MRASTCHRARGTGRKPAASRAGRPTPAKPGSESETARVNLYDEVTARIIAELEAGRFPWVQPWATAGAPGRPDGDGSAASPGLPRNALTARRYSGVNVLILWGAVIEHGYP